MKRFISAGLLLLTLVTIGGTFAALVWFANEWVVSVLASTAVLGWLAGWLVIAYGKGRVRAAAMGAVVAGAAYGLLALGPWFQAHIGSTLLTSRLLAWVEATHRQPAQPVAVFTTVDMNTVDLSVLNLNTGGYVTTNTIIAGSGVVTTSPQYVVTTIPQPPQSPPAMSSFQSAGHWSFAWLFALAGGMLAGVLKRRPRDDSRAGEEAAR